MSSAKLDHPHLLAWQYWVTFSRFSCAFPGAGIWMYASVSGIPAIGVPLLGKSVLWVLLALNDLFMLTSDFARTDTYIGSIDAQVIVSLATIVAGVTIVSWQLAPRVVFDVVSYIITISFGLAVLCSLCLLVIIVLLAIPLRSHIPLWKLRTCNTKDICLQAPKDNLPRVRTIAGHRRGTQEARNFWDVVDGGVKGFFSRLLFRRVSPVETRTYAFIRNVFATIAMVVLVTRGVLAIMQAQNTFETRMKSERCPGVSWTTIQLLVKNHTIYNDYDQSNWGINVNVETARGGGPCNQETVFATSDSNSKFQAFSCGGAINMYGRPGEGPLYHIEVVSLTGSALVSTDMPRIWLSAEQDVPEVPGTPKNNKTVTLARRAAPLYSTPLILLPGYHLEINAGRIIRCFTKFSMIRDLFKGRSDHTDYILFPITMAGSSPLANTTATATIRVTLQSGLEHLRSQDGFEGLQKDLWPNFQTCDFIEDYRTSTVFDVLGSVGGLFTILASAHLLLFGRPLLWGIFGAKLITPFGLTGALSSEAFKRRLREQYHREPTEDNPDTIRVGAFLQDFVVDLGPARPRSDGQGLQPLTTMRPDHAHLPSQQEASTSQTPLMSSTPPSPSGCEMGLGVYERPVTSGSQ